MNRNDLRRHYRRCGINLLTPRALKLAFLASRSTVIELAEGDRILGGGPIYGVSVLTFDADGHRIIKQPRLSRVLYDREQAEEYFTRLRDRFSSLEMKETRDAQDLA